MRITVLVLGLLLLAGCAIDEGSALAANFEDDWADTEDVAQIDTYGSNTLPFAGSAIGTLILEDGTSADRVAELANELSEYVADHGDVTGEILADGITFTVAKDQGLTEAIVALWGSLAVGDRVTSGVIDLVSVGDDHLDVEVTAVDAAGALAVFEDLAADADLFRPLGPIVSSLSVHTAQEVRPSLRVATDDNGSVPAEAVAAYEAVAAQYAVVSAGLDPDGAVIVVAEGTDPGHAGELARSAAPNLTDIEVTSDTGA